MHEAECRLQLRVRIRTEDMDPRLHAGFTARGLPLSGTVVEVEPGHGAQVYQDNGSPPQRGHNVFAWAFSEIEPCPGEALPRPEGA